MEQLFYPIQIVKCYYSACWKVDVTRTTREISFVVRHLDEAAHVSRHISER